MKFEPTEPPRVFSVSNGKIQISDCGKIKLETDEQVTFVSKSGGEYDVARKAWGYYATPSINQRLKNFGYRTALVKSTDGKVYVFIVESGKDADFEKYLSDEGHQIVEWLHEWGSVTCLCGASAFESVAIFKSPPKIEVKFEFGAGVQYHRELLRCQRCGHFRSVHQMDDSKLYSGDYVTANYGDSGIEKTFTKIIALDPARSDNTGRVKRVLDFAHNYFGTVGTPSVLDVGSGLCVFLYKMNGAGWKCTALDPDARSAEHARKKVGIDAIHGDFMKTAPTSKFDVLTLNKVIEHVQDPVAMVARAGEWLKSTGFIYLEVPDGEAAIEDGDGAEREEFTIDHPHAFSAASLAILAKKAGFRALTIERLREPSGKYTLRAFLAPKD